MFLKIKAELSFFFLSFDVNRTVYIQNEEKKKWLHCSNTFDMISYYLSTHYSQTAFVLVELYDTSMFGHPQHCLIMQIPVQYTQAALLLGGSLFKFLPAQHAVFG